MYSYGNNVDKYRCRYFLEDGTIHYFSCNYYTYHEESKMLFIYTGLLNTQHCIKNVTFVELDLN